MRCSVGSLVFLLWDSLSFLNLQFVSFAKCWELSTILPFIKKSRCSEIHPVRIQDFCLVPRKLCSLESHPASLCPSPEATLPHALSLCAWPGTSWKWKHPTWLLRVRLITLLSTCTPRWQRVSEGLSSLRPNSIPSAASHILLHHHPSMSICFCAEPFTSPFVPRLFVLAHGSLLGWLPSNLRQVLLMSVILELAQINSFFFPLKLRSSWFLV